MSQGDIAPNSAKRDIGPCLYNHSPVTIRLFEIGAPDAPIATPLDSPPLKDHTRARPLLPTGIQPAEDIGERSANLHDGEIGQVVVDPERCGGVGLMVWQRNMID